MSQICVFAKKGTFFRTSRPQAKGQPRGEKIANAPIPPSTIEVGAALFVPKFVCIMNGGKVVVGDNTNDGKQTLIYQPSGYSMLLT